MRFVVQPKSFMQTMYVNKYHLNVMEEKKEEMFCL